MMYGKKGGDLFVRHGSAVTPAKFRIDLISHSGGEEFLKFINFNPIWLPNHVTDDIINLDSASNWVGDHACEVLSSSDKAHFFYPRWLPNHDTYQLFTSRKPERETIEFPFAKYTFKDTVVALASAIQHISNSRAPWSTTYPSP